MTFDELKDLLRGENLRFFTAEDRPMVRLGIRGMFGLYEVALLLQEDGTLLQFRTASYLVCPPKSPHLAAVLRLLAHLSHQYRFVKFGWNPDDGEIAVAGDIWVMDGQVTPLQFGRMWQNFLPAVDMEYPRIHAALETGRDPGAPTPQGLASRLLEAGAPLPEPVRDLLERLRRKSPGGEPPEDITEL